MSCELNYKIGIVPDINAIIEIYDSSGINRPTTDRERIKKMYDHSNLVVSAWDNGKLVGIARSLTDFCYCCYLSDLAVRKEYQAKGVGKKLVELTKNKIGNQTTLLLVSAPALIEYYPKIGFQKSENTFVMRRTE